MLLYWLQDVYLAIAVYLQEHFVTRHYLLVYLEIVISGP